MTHIGRQLISNRGHLELVAEQVIPQVGRAIVRGHPPPRSGSLPPKCGGLMGNDLLSTDVRRR